MAEHVAQEAHTEEECKINEAPYNHPSTDCGHYVNSGPGTVQTEDKNTYATKNVENDTIVAGPNAARGLKKKD